MKKLIIFFIILAVIRTTLKSQEVYVDNLKGLDKNVGTKDAPFKTIQKALEIIRNQNNEIYTIRINPGLYILEKYASVSTEKGMAGKHIVIEATVMPDDSGWTPEKMPVIISISQKGEIPDQDSSFVAAFLIDADHVTIRGLKFPGYFYPNTRYFPIARLNLVNTDLLVEQCLFVGDEDASHLQVGIIAHGNSVRVDHCVFYNVRNSVVFWMGHGIKTGNGITNSIIFGATQSGVWTAWPDRDFMFENNIISNCKHFWMKNEDNTTTYTMEDCIVVKNEHFKATAGESGIVPAEFDIVEKNIIKEGNILLRKKDPFAHLPLPQNYLHIVPGYLGDNLNAGLFKEIQKKN